MPQGAFFVFFVFVRMHYMRKIQKQLRLFCPTAALYNRANLAGERSKPHKKTYKKKGEDVRGLRGHLRVRIGPIGCVLISVSLKGRGMRGDCIFSRLSALACDQPRTHIRARVISLVHVHPTDRDGRFAGDATCVGHRLLLPHNLAVEVLKLFLARCSNEIRWKKTALSNHP